MRFGGFGYLLDQFFGFWAKKRRFFGFVVHCVLRIFCFQHLVFDFRQNFDGYSDLVSDVLCWFFILGFWFLFDLSSSYTPLLISNNRETYGAPPVTTVSDRLGF